MARKAGAKKQPSPPKKRAKVVDNTPPVKKPHKVFSIFEQPDGYVVYKTAPTKAGIPMGEQLGKLHKSIANIEAVKERWVKDAESKKLKRVEL